MTPADFSDSRFIRTGGGVSFEERGAQPSDFTAALGYPYAKQYADAPSIFSVYYPNWQVPRVISSLQRQNPCSVRKNTSSNTTSPPAAMRTRKKL